MWRALCLIVMLVGITDTARPRNRANTQRDITSETC
jgi:hypothetical protein